MIRISGQSSPARSDIKFISRRRIGLSAPIGASVTLPKPGSAGDWPLNRLSNLKLLELFHSCDLPYFSVIRIQKNTQLKQPLLQLEFLGLD